MDEVVGWYVHHHGRGHVTRAETIAAQLRWPVVGLSSLPAPGGPFAEWVALPADDGAREAGDPTAYGALHWAPRRDAGVAARVAALTGWIARARPLAMVIDVSVEATVAARLAGVPVVVVAMPGHRADAPHQLAYRLADRILAFWPRELYDPAWLQPWEHKTHWLGAMSRFDGRPVGTGGDDVVLLGGAGDDAGSSPRSSPTDWRRLAGDHWEDDPWPSISTARVIVTHAGQNALAEVAAARRPAVVVPAPRPFGEQAATAAALARAGLAVVEPRWPAPEEWPELLGRAQQLGGDGWRRWSTGTAAAAAAGVIDDVARTGAAW